VHTAGYGEHEFCAGEALQSYVEVRHSNTRSAFGADSRLSGIVCTPENVELEGLLPRMENLVTPNLFDPTRDKSHFRISGPDMAANVIRRFKSTCRSFSKRMATITIMHEPHVLVWPSLSV
jgi:hypothetical protein